MGENTPATTDQLSPAGRAVVAAICIATGAGIAALAAGIIPLEESKFHAPHWVVGACAVAFVLAGAMVLVPPAMQRVQGFIGAALMTLFAAIPGWIAFGPGQRAFGGAFSFGGVTSASHPGETMGRIVFGIGAVLLGLAAAYTWVRWLRSVLGSSDDERNDGA